MAKRNKQRLTITLDQHIVSLIDDCIDGKQIRNRSHAIEYILSQQLRPTVQQAVILASGDGVNMRPFTYEIPKPLLPVKGRPILEYSIEMLRDANVRDIVLVVSHLADKIRNHFGDGSKYGVSLTYVEEKTPRGTARSLKAAKKYLNTQSPFVLMYGDVLLNLDLSDLLTLHEEQEAFATLALTTTADPGGYGVVRLRGNSVVGFSEKPTRSATSALINAGVMVFSSGIFSYVEQRGVTALEEDVLSQVVKNEDVIGYPFEGTWFDVGTPEEYERAVKEWG